MDVKTARRRIAEQAHLNAFISLSEEDGPGPVVGVKDLIDVRGMVTTGGGAQLPAVPAREDASCVRFLRAFGCSVVGKTNLHEWALGPTSANPHYGAVLNPRDPTRIPGGSSGGSAAAVAAGLCDWAIGTDTGGSIRMPASLCGVVGYKPTIGNIPLLGVIPLAHSLDTVGSLAPDVVTAVRGVEMMASKGSITPSEPALMDRVKLAVPAGWVEGLDEETARAWEAASHGLPEIDFPSRQPMTEATMAIAGFESAEYHHRWMEDHPERYGSDVLERLRTGAAITDRQHSEALWAREMFRTAVREAMHGWDVILLPATACVAPKLDDPDRREPLTRFLRAFSLTGQPVITIPAPVEGLPVGIQVIGHFGDDAHLARVALALERAWRGSTAERAETVSRS
jgi:Asp-tRNA(Asn)/Glu-tRNA(Gln) amidotransferase A subunit family amidase